MKIKNFYFLVLFAALFTACEKAGDEMKNDGPEILFEEYSVWKYIDNNGTIIELTFYPGNKIHIKSTPEELGHPPYRMGGNVIIDYCIIDDKMYWKNPDDDKFDDRFFWEITNLSENEIVLGYVYLGFQPYVALGYIDKYLFIRQTN